METRKKASAFAVIFGLMLLFSACGDKDVNGAEMASSKSPAIEQAAKRPQKGIWKNNTYRSEFADITFTMQEGWGHLTMEELDEMNNAGVSAANEIAQKTYDMVATSAEGESVYIFFDYQPGKEGKEHSDAVKEYLETLREEATSPETNVMGYRADNMVETKTIGSQSYGSITLTADAGYMLRYLARQQDDFMIVLMVTASQHNVDQMEEMFA